MRKLQLLSFSALLVCNVALPAEQSQQQVPIKSEVLRVVSAEELRELDTLLSNIKQMIVEAKRSNQQLDETIAVLSKEVDLLRVRMVEVRERNEMLEKRNSRFLLK